MWRRGGVQEPIHGEPQWPIDVLWIPSLPRPPWKTDQWDRIQTSEVESQWCPVMRGWTGGSDDWQCQKRRTDPAEWGLMIWNRRAENEWLPATLTLSLPAVWTHSYALLYSHNNSPILSLLSMTWNICVPFQKARPSFPVSLEVCYDRQCQTQH